MFRWCDPLFFSINQPLHRSLIITGYKMRNFMRSQDLQCGPTLMYKVLLAGF
jgi:hypothetical protein